MTIKKTNIKNIILVFIVLFFGFTIAFLNFPLFLKSDKNIFSSNLQASIPDSIELKENISQSQLLIENDRNNAINAESAIILKVSKNQEEILFSKNEEKKLPIASLTKLMTALIVLENYNLNQAVVIDEFAMSQEGEQGALKLGETLSVRNLLYITLIESSNRAASVLAGVIGRDYFVYLMNSKAKDLGLSNTRFEDPTGLDSKNYSTAKDLARLSKYLFENYPLFREITILKEFNLYLPDGSFHHKLVNTNELLGQNRIIGGKTGWTDEARGCFMAIQTNGSFGDYLIYVILGAENRLVEMKNLINLIGSQLKFIFS